MKLILLLSILATFSGCSKKPICKDNEIALSYWSLFSNGSCTPTPKQIEDAKSYRKRLHASMDRSVAREVRQRALAERKAKEAERRAQIDLIKQALREYDEAKR